MRHFAIEHPFEKPNHVMAHFFYHQEFFRSAGLAAEQKFLAKSPTWKINYVYPLREASVMKGVVLSNPFQEPYVLSTARHHDLSDVFEVNPVLIRFHTALL